MHPRKWLTVTHSCSSSSVAKRSLSYDAARPAKSPRKRVTRRTKEEEPVQETNGVMEKKGVMATLTPSALSDLSNLSFEAPTETSEETSVIETTLRRAAARRSLIYGSGARFNTLKNVTKIIPKVQFEKEICINY